MWHEILHAIIDSLYLLPFLFVCYILIELIESWTSKGSNKLSLQNGSEVLIGSTAGLIPQCGFGVVATDLYSKRKISMGTLIAIYIATSDEAFPILLSHPEKAGALIPLLLLKFAFALIVGYIVYFIERRLKRKTLLTEALNNHEHHEHTHEHHEENDEENEHVHIGCCGHHIEENDDNSTKSKLKRYLLHPLKHTLHIFVYILVMNVAFSLLVHTLGEESISNFLLQAKAFTPLLAIVVGLIPNCASSVILTNMYIIGALPFGALLSGLIVNAGIAVTVLFKQNKPVKNTLTIMAILLLTGLVAGYSTLWLI